MLKKVADEQQKKNRELFEQDFNKGFPHSANASVALMNMQEIGNEDENSMVSGGEKKEKSDLDSLRNEFHAELEAERQRHKSEEEHLQKSLEKQRNSASSEVSSSPSQGENFSKSLSEENFSKSLSEENFGDGLGSVASQRERWVQAEEEKAASAETEVNN